ncbi:unnamed protein product [Hermetia illucens]|uniref:Out at first protein n=1 Tax=Hermetia illucens TaxID=343691 RepID=A0A7R8UGK2_HERIL|nr:out at first protein [Hermetia illucens]CAD7080184.1 unnamed protein product [Hermetia illucens]
MFPVYPLKVNCLAIIGLLTFLQLTLDSQSQLLINVQNQGGEVVQETITSNVSDDLITLEFQRTDGTLITQLIDFRNEVRILKALVLGEEERGQSQYQVMCFVTKFTKGDFLSADAVAKLRQKNPSTIRTPEEDKGKESFTMTAWVNLNRSAPITRHLAGLCSEAADATYVRDVDLKAWAELPGSSMSSLESAIHQFPVQSVGPVPVAVPAASSTSAPVLPAATPSCPRCNEVSNLRMPCFCALEMCVGWYPCGLKYCKGDRTDQSANGQNSQNYKCGIKTCRKCSQFIYYVRQKQHCLWDE